MYTYTSACTNMQYKFLKEQSKKLHKKQSLEEILFQKERNKYNVKQVNKNKNK